MLPVRFRTYIKDPWNIVDQMMYIVLFVAVILRFTSKNEHEFVAARYVYAVNLVMFYLRILQLYYSHKHLGPKVVVFWRMVCITQSLMRKQRRDLLNRSNFS